MSTEQDGQARLTRKQLRELRLTGSTPVIGDVEQRDAVVEPDAAPQDPVIQPQPEEHAPPIGAGAPLTRRAARALERQAESAPEAAEQRDAEPETVEPEIVEPEIVEPEAVERDSGESAVAEPEVVSAVPDFPTSDDSAEHEERPMVGAAFGIGVKRAPHGQHPAPAAFDDLLETGSSGSHKTASTLIFTPSPGAGSLSGPVASTGELLITGTYALPEGMGSQGHALGTTDGRDVDAVLIDGELAPASSPTPIAASSAISTSKPAGEVIRPPVPDKSSKLTLTLAIVAGGLALALATALVIAFTSGVLS
ncbi:hypothetical protein [Microbacterium sp. USHLN186]|uniref:hypothetical protein n=1 Tax=Microbacterium sp. USHLN186 TaxID=3081286 RepID=UPI00301698C2